MTPEAAILLYGSVALGVSFLCSILRPFCSAPLGGTFSPSKPGCQSQLVGGSPSRMTQNDPTAILTLNTIATPWVSRRRIPS